MKNDQEEITWSLWEKFRLWFACLWLAYFVALGVVEVLKIKGGM